MTAIFSLRRITLIIFSLLLASFAWAAIAHAQSSEDAVKKYNVTFPISQLGGCKDYAACRTFCEDPVNKDACIAFAKSKGFYKEDALQSQKSTILAKAKATLGCDSESSCLNFCEVPANHDKCDSFAKSVKLSGGIVAKPDDKPILEKAKAILGCDSKDSCKSLCEQEGNRAKCADFARQAGLRGGEQKVGPGGCTSEATCKAFCSNPDNYQICAGFTKVTGGQFSGPGGCNSPESCRAYCQQNPSSCSSTGGQTGSNQGNYGSRDSQEAACRAGGGTCDFSSGICNCQSYHPTSSNGSSSEDPATACARGGCNWTGTSCQCPTSTTNTTSSSTDPADMCRKTAGCTWTGSTCNCGGSGTTTPPPTSSETPPPPSSIDPATVCAQTSGCSWTGSTCSCTHGISVSRGLLQQLLDWFRR